MNLSQRSSEETGNPVSLETTLRALGYPPIAPELVAAYERQQIESAFKPTRLGHLLHAARIAPRVAHILVYYLIPILAIAIGATIMLWSVRAPTNIFLMSCGTVLLLGGVAVFHIAKITPRTVMYPAEWVTIPWGHHARRYQVPEWAFELHGLLTTLMPKATFEIRELRQGSFMLDPELICDDQVIAIWDDNGNKVDL